MLGTLGLGSAPGQKAGYEPIDDSEAFALLDRAWDSGVRDVDTALSYGSGTAVRRLSAWQADRGHRLSVAAKLGRPLRDASIVADYSLDGLRRELDDYHDLNLSTDTILIKDPPAELFSGVALSDMLAILREHAGASGVGLASHRHDLCRDFSPPFLGFVVQLEANAVNWVVAERTVTWLSARGADVWAMQPLAAGVLAASAAKLDALHRDDWRNAISPEVRRMLYEQAAPVAASLRSAAPDLTVATSAILFLLGAPGVGRVVLGPRTCRQLDDLLFAGELFADDRGQELVARVGAE